MGACVLSSLEEHILKTGPRRCASQAAFIVSILIYLCAVKSHQHNGSNAHWLGLRRMLSWKTQTMFQHSGHSKQQCAAPNVTMKNGTFKLIFHVCCKQTFFSRAAAVFMCLERVCTVCGCSNFKCSLNCACDVTPGKTEKQLKLQTVREGETWTFVWKTQD